MRREEGSRPTRPARRRTDISHEVYRPERQPERRTEPRSIRRPARRPAERIERAPEATERARAEAGARRARQPAEARQRDQRAARAPLLTRGRLRGITGALAVVLAGILLSAALGSPLFAVRRVEVTGLAALTPEEAAQVQALAVVPARTNLFRAPSGRLARALKALPWVTDATVARRLPGRLVVRLTPRVPVATVASASGRWEVDAGGVAIRATSVAAGEANGGNAALPEISVAGPAEARPGERVDAPGVPEALKLAAEAAGAASARGAKPLPIARIEVDQSAELCLNMRDSVAIRLGQADDLSTKIALVERIYQERPDIGTAVLSIDLRCPQMPACLPRQAARESSQDGTIRPAALRNSGPASGAPIPAQAEDGRDVTRAPLASQNPQTRSRRDMQQAAGTSDASDARDPGDVREEGGGRAVRHSRRNREER